MHVVLAAQKFAYGWFNSQAVFIFLSNLFLFKSEPFGTNTQYNLMIFGKTFFKFGQLGYADLPLEFQKIDGFVLIFPIRISILILFIRPFFFNFLFFIFGILARNRQSF